MSNLNDGAGLTNGSGLHHGSGLDDDTVDLRTTDPPIGRHLPGVWRGSPHIYDGNRRHEGIGQRSDYPAPHDTPIFSVGGVPVPKRTFYAHLNFTGPNNGDLGRAFLKAGEETFHTTGGLVGDWERRKGLR